TSPVRPPLERFNPTLTRASPAAPSSRPAMTGRQTRAVVATGGNPADVLQVVRTASRLNPTGAANEAATQPAGTRASRTSANPAASINRQNAIPRTIGISQQTLDSGAPEQPVAIEDGQSPRDDQDVEHGQESGDVEPCARR